MTPRDAEIGRAGGPDRADAGGGEHGDDRLRHVRDEAGDAVARLDGHGLESLREAGDLIVELIRAEPPLYLVLAPEDDGLALVAPAQQVFGKVQPRRGEEAGTGHAIAILERDRAARLVDDTAERPDGLPELVGRLDRPVVEILKSRDIRAPLLAHGGDELRHVRRGDALRARPPERLSCITRQVSSRVQAHGLGSAVRPVPFAV